MSRAAPADWYRATGMRLRHSSRWPQLSPRNSLAALPPGWRNRASRAGWTADVLRADAAARAILLLCVRPAVVGRYRFAGTAPLGAEDAPAEDAAAQAESTCLRAALRERHGLVPCYLRAGHGGGCREAGKRQVHAGSDDLGEDQEPAVQSGSRTRRFFQPPQTP